MPDQESNTEPELKLEISYAEKIMNTLRELDRLIEKIERIEDLRFNSDFAAELVSQGLINENEVELLVNLIPEGRHLSETELVSGWLKSKLAVTVSGSAELGQRIRELDLVRVQISRGGPSTDAEFDDSDWVKVTSSGDKAVEARLKNLAPIVWDIAIDLQEWVS